MRNLYVLNAQHAISARDVVLGLEENLDLRSWHVRGYNANQLFEVVQEVATTEYLPCVVVVLAIRNPNGWAATHSFFPRLGERVSNIVVVGDSPCPVCYKLQVGRRLVVPGEFIGFNNETVISDILSRLGLEQIA